LYKGLPLLTSSGQSFAQKCAYAVLKATYLWQRLSRSQSSDRHPTDWWWGIRQIAFQPIRGASRAVPCGFQFAAL